MPEDQKVLVVDDERINRKQLCALLEDVCEVIQAKSGFQALDRLAGDPGIDLVLLDVMMPELDGYEVLRRLKAAEATRDIPVIFITARDTVEDEELGLSLGAADYIAKPFQPAVVRLRVANHLSFVRQRKLLETLAGRDGLTEIPNRRRFDEVLAASWAEARARGAPISLAILDLDCFKSFNDRLGHRRGDAALREVAAVVHQAALARPGALAARYGGEEFALLMPDTGRADAAATAERLRTTVAALGMPHPASTTAGHVTVSIGVATALPADPTTPDQLVERADQLLFDAKDRGRNRVVSDPGQ